MARLVVRTLGGVAVLLDALPLAGVESDKARALLVYLAMEAGRAHTRETLAGLLWPNVAETSARASLSQALSNLRRVLQDGEDEAAFFVAHRNTIQFNAASDHAVDAVAFERSVKQAQAAASSTATVTAIALLQAAADQYTGAFLEGFHLRDSDQFDEWVTVTRERLQRQALEVLSRLTAIYRDAQMWESALRAAQRQLAIDAWREEAHQYVMQALAVLGRRSEALMQYERCRRVLAAELGIEPSAETRALFERIQRNELAPVPPRTVTSEPLAVPSPSVQSPAAGPPASSPPATGLPAAHKLPVLLTTFIGRKRELERLKALLANPDCRLLTLVGAGGMGKTRLAIQAAYEQREQFADGAVFVPLTPVTTRDAALTALAGALGFTFSGSADPREQVLNELRDKALLLVLDNFEQLVAESDLAQDILLAAPGIKLIVTTRQPLNLQGEWLFEVHGLTLSPSAPTPAPIDPHGENSAAVQLFVQSARRVQAGFALTPDNARAIGQICKLVAGMPLGIELAASWARVLTCDEIADEIERSIDFLATTQRGVPERHRSMSAIIEQTWRMLSEMEQRVLARLSVFRGGFTRDLASQVAGATLPILSGLVSKTLLRRTAESRYDLHELVRQYAAAALRTLGRPDAPNTLDETHAVCQKHATAFLAVAERAAQGQPMANSREPYLALEAEHNNLRAALEWCERNCDDATAAQMGLQLAVGLGRFWLSRGHWAEGRGWLERMQALPQVQGLGLLRAQALMHLCVLWRPADLAGSLRFGEAGLELARAAGDAPLVALTLYELSQTAVLGWKLDLARGYGEEALERYRQLGDLHGVAVTLSRLAAIALPQKRHDDAVHLLHESIALLETTNDRGSMASAYVLLAQAIAERDQNWAEATLYADKGREIFEAQDARMGLQWAWGILGRLAFHQHEFALARAHVCRSLALCWELGALVNIRDALNVLAQIEQHLNRPAHGVRLFAAAAQVARGLGIPFAEATVQTGTQVARAALSPQAFAAAWAEGEHMPLEQIMQQALQPPPGDADQAYGAGPAVIPVTAGGI